MLILGIDTATTSVSVALSKGSPSSVGGIIGVQTLSVGPRHAETLLPAIEFLCGQCSVALSEITHLVVDRGPGLFTGLRVGVATARTLAFAQDAPLFGVTSLEAIAWEAARAGERIVVVLDARRSELYAAVFDRTPDGLVEVVAPLVGTYEAVLPLLTDAAADRSIHVVGDAVSTHRSVLAPLLDRAGASSGGPLAPSAVGLIDALLARPLEGGPNGDEADILYLRAPDAQITWDNRHGPAPR